MQKVQLVIFKAFENKLVPSSSRTLHNHRTFIFLSNHVGVTPVSISSRSWWTLNLLYVIFFIRIYRLFLSENLQGWRYITREGIRGMCVCVFSHSRYLVFGLVQISNTVINVSSTLLRSVSLSRQYTLLPVSYAHIPSKIMRPNFWRTWNCNREDKANWMPKHTKKSVYLINEYAGFKYVYLNLIYIQIINRVNECCVMILSCITLIPVLTPI